MFDFSHGPNRQLPINTECLGLIFETDYKKLLIEKLSRVVEHPHRSDTSPSSAALDEWSLKFPASGVGSSTGTVGPVEVTLCLLAGTGN